MYVLVLVVGCVRTYVVVHWLKKCTYLGVLVVRCYVRTVVATMPDSDAPDAIRNQDADGIPMDAAAGGAADKGTDVDEATDEDAHADDAITNEDAHGIATDVAADLYAEYPTDKDGDANGTATMPASDVPGAISNEDAPAADDAKDEKPKFNAEEIALHDRISAETPRPYVPTASDGDQPQQTRASTMLH